MTRTALICPASRPGVSQLGLVQPLVLAPILGESLVSHWIEHLACRGIAEITIFAADRADEIRLAVGDGRRWGVRIEVREAKLEPTVPEARLADPSAGEAIVMTHLPAMPNLPLFESYAGWFAAIAAWMPLALTPARVRLAETQPGIWMSRRAHVSPRAQLIPPCWIGDQAIVRAGAIVGPGAILEDRAVVETGARVVESIVGVDTYVGKMTSVASSLALGDTLVNWRSDSWLRVPDPFLLCSLARSVDSRRGGKRQSTVRRLAGIAAMFSKFTARPEAPGIAAVPVVDRHTTP